MTLFLDTTDYNAITLVLTDGKILHKQYHKLNYNENDKTLLLLDKFLKKHKFSLKKDTKIAKIIVCTGPGSFTGTRVGVTIALALRFALGIKIAGIKKSQIPEDLRKLASIKGSASLKVSYNRPAV